MPIFNPKNKLIKSKYPWLIFLLSISTTQVYAEEFSCPEKHMPVKIVDKLNNQDVKDLFFLAKGLHVSNQGIRDGDPCLVTFTKNVEGIGIGACEKVNATTKATSYWFKAADFTKGLCMPMVESGRIYFSLNYRLDNLRVDTGSEGKDKPVIIEPDAFKPGDVDYHKLWDKIEFTYIPNKDDLTVWANPTAVDFFSLPIQLKLGDDVSGFSKSRSEIFTTVQKTFDKYSGLTSGQEWNKLFLYSKEEGSQTHILRLMSPGKAIQQTVQPNTKTFHQTYLSHNGFDFNYLDSVWDYYKTNKLSIDVSEQYKNAPGSDIVTGQVVTVTNIKNKKVPVFQFKGTRGKAIGTTVQFSQPVILTIGKDGSQNPPNPDDYEAGSRPFFAGAGFRDENAKLDDFDSRPNALMLGPVIQREVTSAFTAGMLPAPPISPPADSNYAKIWHKSDEVNYGVMLSKEYFEFARIQTPSMFYQNTILNNLHPEQKNKGPWYDLYSQALHSIGEPIYTFAYDDALGQDGTLSQTNPGLLTITLGDTEGFFIPPIGENEDAYHFIFTFAQIGDKFPDAYYCNSKDVSDEKCLKGQWIKLDIEAGKDFVYYLNTPLILKDVDTVKNISSTLQISALHKNVKAISEDARANDLSGAIVFEQDGPNLRLKFPAF